MVFLQPIPEHFRSQEKFDAYIAELRKELVPLLTSNVYIRRENLKHRQDIHATLTNNEQKEYNSFKDKPHFHITTIGGCSDAFTCLLESIQAHKCLFILDANKRLFVLKTVGALGVFDVYGRKFGRLSNDIYIYLTNEYVDCQKNGSIRHIKIPYDLKVDQVYNDDYGRFYDSNNSTLKHEFIRIGDKHIHTKKLKQLHIDTKHLDGKHIPPYDGPATVIICDWLARIYKNYICDHIPLRQI